ncbi:Sulfhydrogenase subunit alpha [hydrothermal vent metagenome]|uniref:Sulfhydrogenase subunit alpha n=1 Tax=hydrothermal vent metagenome TaxID=652676 RepID=A0A3B1DPC7_9ZZZZ
MTKKKSKTKIIKVDTLARVEGEGSLYIKVKDGSVEDVRLKIFEPPRFFEAFLRDRDFKEVPDITARICGICPVAYQMSSVHAMEDALGVKVDGPLRELRRLLYCGEWIESHVLHIFMLHAPDFLGYEDAICMAKDHRDIVERGLKLKKAGNDLMAKIGGREIHPINVRVGGFFKVFKKRELKDLVEQLKWAREAALETVRWTAKLSFPEFEQDYEFVALRHPDEYPVNEGRLVSSAGLDIDISQFNQHFEEEHVEHSNALHSVLKERGAYFVGPMARFNLNFDRLSPIAKEAAQQAGLSGKCNNPFKSIIVRSVEVLYACDEALRILENYEMPDSPYMEIEPKAGTGHGCTEAPRGILYHRYTIDDSGKVLDAQIVPPTSQNQKTIENDLKHFVAKYLDLPDAELTWQCEQAIRNYDPCISCATHFLKLEMDRQ